MQWAGIKVGFMKEDRWHGEYKEWYTTGLPKSIGRYFEGKDGEWKFYDRKEMHCPIYFSRMVWNNP